MSIPGVAQLCNIPRFVNCLFAQFCKVRVPAYWNRTDPMGSESIGDPSLRLHPSSVCFTINSSSQSLSRLSDQYAYSHACSKNTVRLHASSLPAPYPTPLVKGLEKATYGLDHDTCIQPYDTIHATTPFSSLLCLGLSPPRVETLLTSPHRLLNNSTVGGESPRILVVELSKRQQVVLGVPFGQECISCAGSEIAEHTLVPMQP